MDKVILLGIGITNATENKILEYIVNSVQKTQKNYYVTTPNPEMLVLASQNKRFATILNQAQVTLADGVGLLWAAKLLDRKLKARVTGTDLVDSLCKKIAGKPITVGFLGGRDDVADETAECLQKKYPGLQVVFVGKEWPTKVESGKLIDILFVAFGFPKQEEWMAKHIGKNPVKIMIGVGGAFDYISGRVPRAPVFVRNLGFEWLFRLIVQPWRIKRQFALIKFILLVLKEKFL